MSPLRKDITMPSSRLGPGGSSSAAFDEPRMTDSISKSVIYCLIQICMSGYFITTYQQSSLLLLLLRIPCLLVYFLNCSVLAYLLRLAVWLWEEILAAS